MNKNTLGTLAASARMTTGKTLRLSASALAIFISIFPGEPADAQAFSDGVELASNLTSVSSLAAGDLDGDGDKDIVGGRSGFTNFYLLNNGDGSFGSVQSIGIETDPTLEVELADVNGDSRLDVVAANGESQLVWRTNRVYLNGGLDGGSIQWTKVDIPQAEIDFDLGGPNPPVRTETPSRYVVVGDIDGQNGPDAVFGNCCGASGIPNQLYLNDGAGYSSNDPPPNLNSDDTFGLAIGDIDNDTDLDVVENGTGILNTCENISGSLFCGGTMPLVSSTDLELADLNGDNFLDVLVGGFISTDTHVYLNDGTGSFPDPGSPVGGNPVLNVTSLGTADVDGDGTQDFVEGNGTFDTPNQLFLNNGDGSFAASMPVSDEDVLATTALVVSDFDRDCAPDLVALHAASLKFYRNITEKDRLLNLSDLGGDGRDDVGAIRHCEVEIFDAPTEASIRRLQFLDESWVFLDSGVVGDPAINAADSKTVSLAASEVTGSITAQVRTSLTGALTKNVQFFNPDPSDFTAVSLVVVPDIDPNPGDEVGVLAYRDSTGEIIIQLRDAVSGAFIRQLFYLNPNWTPMAAITLPHFGGFDAPEVGVLATNDMSGSIVVMIKDSWTNEFLGNVFFLNANWIPVQVIVLPDFSENGAAEIGLLAENATTGKLVIMVKDAASNVFLRNVFPLGSGWNPIKVAMLPDENSNAGVELATLGANKVSGKLVIQVRDAKSGQFLRNLTPLGSNWAPTDMVALDDIGAGAPGLSVLAIRKSDGLRVVQTINAITGDLVSNVVLN